MTPKARDMIALVRTARCLVFKQGPHFPQGDDMIGNIEAYWRERFVEGSFWTEALALAKAGQYDELGQKLRKLI
jgi:hypothetical protein